VSDSQSYAKTIAAASVDVLDREPAQCDGLFG
jgi:hypothetical protein